MLHNPVGTSSMLNSLDQTVRRLKASRVEQDRSGRVSVSDGRNIVVLCPGMSTVLVNGRPVRNGHFVHADERGILVPEELLTMVEKLFKETGIKKLRKIVIDAGHGGKDPGAIGRGGLTEKQINLSVALRLAKIFKRRGVETVLVRDRDVFLSLDQRVRVCNREQPDLFLSVHANANRSRVVTGVQTFFIKKTMDDFLRARAAIKSGRREVEGVRLKKNDGYLGLALYHTMYDMSRRESLQIGSSVQKKLSRDLYSENRGVTGAGYRVLKGAMCPALLVEVGFLSNPSTERKFRKSSYLDRIAASIAGSI
ncbi:N-acetylmuramoyl-L-alanine amidase [Planctomycetota bacterium]